jgi:nitrogen fixation/metabolism regulation signal transduction histidine kinase
MSGNPKNQRKTLIVYPELQKRFIRDVSVVPLVALSMGIVLMGISFRLVLLQAAAADVVLPSIYGLLISMAAFVFVAAFVTVNMAVRISNRVAGPIYRLNQSMEQLRKGEENCRVTFRKGDYMLDTADVFNALAETIEAERKQNGQESVEAEEKEEEPSEVGACSK